jgi:integrase
MPRRNSKRLTDPGIEKMRKAQKGKRLEVFEALADGLCLRVTEKGSKSWCVFYRFPDDKGEIKNRRLTLGPWPAIGVSQAREEALRVKAQAKAGIDPRTARALKEEEEKARAEREARETFGAIAETYIARECPGLARGTEIEALIRNRLIPTWKNRHVRDLCRKDLVALTDKLLDEDKPAAALQLHEVARRVFNWALNRGDIDATPFANMKPPAQKAERGRALKEHELKALWEIWEAQGNPFGKVQQLLLLTGQRRSEAAEMQWSELDLAKAEWVIPAERSKSRREHIVPLVDSAVRLLSSLPRFEAGNFVFTTTIGRRPISGFSKAKTRTDKSLKEALEKDDRKFEPWRVHDLRRTCRTGLASLGVPEIVSERVLNHVPRGLARIYNVHEYADEKRDALECWARHLETIINPPPENVVQLSAEREAG